MKTIRSNLLLPWLADQFPVEIVYLMRHPCAVIGSQRRLGWRFELDDVYAQPLLMDEVLPRFTDCLQSAKTPLEQLAVLWCIENVIPVEMTSQGLCRQLIFEEYETRPAGAFPDLLNKLGLTPTFATRLAMGTRVSSPSQLRNATKVWHAPLTLDEGRHVMEIVREFGLDSFVTDRSSLSNSMTRYHPQYRSRAVL